MIYNMMELFINGFAGDAYAFKISPQGNRFNVEIRYDMDKFENIKDAITYIKLIANKFYNKIF